MNIKVLNTLEKGWVKYDWSVIPDRYNTPNVWESVVDTISRFVKNKSVREIVILKCVGLPAYVTIKRTEYRTVLNWLQEQFILSERYEMCKWIEDIKSNIK